MKVIVSKKVYDNIAAFYGAALLLHETLDEITVNNKIDRLEAALKSLGNYPYLYPYARLKKEWIDLNYREFICEDFHFAYQIAKNDKSEICVFIEDAVHSLLYRE